MRTRPDGFEEGTLAGALRRYWGLPVSGVRYAPVGFGDYHWEANGEGARWFVTLTDLLPRPDEGFATLRAAMETAAALAGDAGLDFVVAPLPTRDGRRVLRLGERYALAVFPFVEGEAGTFGDPFPPAERAEVLRLLDALHGSTAAVGGVPVWTPALPGRPAFEAALEELERPWPGGGPYAEPARALLARHGAGALREVLAAYDALVAEVAARGHAPVVTHGEPHPGNVLRAPGGGLLLVDWDTVGLAPRERDLWHLGEEAAAEAGADPAALRMCRLRWDLDDVLIYLGVFRAPHARTPDTDLAWQGFTTGLDTLVADLTGG
ncbi:phosphotransferase [Streptomyces sp. DSM 44917]|uniref:Phosphotransferase n=1 Tax=Streptomyces boetiae TaxID=3075541 RepID=A0ABU2LCH5_9ACTN|nr:phosphotransferase [Streptomyces sp. DSM 44917]MDT0309286.1 phosphotransferase [Streptomyces sp. DSM 44917]